MNTYPQPLAANGSDTCRILIVRNLAMLESYEPESPTNKASIEEARKELERLSDTMRLTTDDRELIDKILSQLRELGVPVVEIMNR